MSRETTRRGFLQDSVAAGSALAAVGLPRAAWAASSASATQRSPASTAEVIGNAPVSVIVQSVSRDVNPRASSWSYLAEILQRGGVFFEQTTPAQLPSLPGQPNRILMLAGDLRLTAAQRDALANAVKNGASLIGVGGTSGLDEVFGVKSVRPLAEGWIKVTAQKHPVTAGLRSSLHVFGGYGVTAGSATALAQVEGGRQGAKGGAILENRFGKGRALLLAPDLVFSIVHIQQGLPVLQDGRPAPDGSAAVNDGALKAEDGLVLDWERDRTPMQPDGVPVFLEPVSDELREIILRSIFHVASQQKIALPLLWYWPAGLKAVGHISHDTDGNDPKKAVSLLEVMNRNKLKSTWCTLYPGGYPREFYRTLKQQGFEIALHFDAKTGGQQTLWSKENFLMQHRWLLQEAELEHITSNKNHYTRWESRLDFLRWCQEVGINSDQTRGPSKQGTIGFPLGGSQPYFPLDDEAETPRLLKVLEVNLLTQDLVVVCPREYGKQLTDCVLRHHGVAHFLFHPAHIQKAEVAQALGGLVDYGRQQGIEWWTSEQIYHWETLRRGVEARFNSTNTFTLHAGAPLSQATLLVLRASQKPNTVGVNGQAVSCQPWKLHGFEFDAVTTDVAGSVKVQIS